MSDDKHLMFDAASLRAMDRMLQELPARVAGTVVAKASRAAYAPVLETAKSLVTRRTGLLRKSLGLKQKRYGGRASSAGDAGAAGYVYTIVGPRTGFKDPVTGENPVNIAHLVEFGTGPHLIAPKGHKGELAIKRGSGPTVIVSGAVKHPGAHAQPFIRPAFDRHRSSIIPTFGREIGVGVDREAAKLAWAVKP